MRIAARSIFIASALAASLGASAWDGSHAVTSIVSDIDGSHAYIENGNYLYRSSLIFNVQCPAPNATVSQIDTGGRGAWQTENCDANGNYSFYIMPSEMPNSSNYAPRSVSLSFANAAGADLGTLSANVNVSVSQPNIQVTSQTLPDGVNRQLTVNVSTFAGDAQGPTNVYMLAYVSGSFFSLTGNADGSVGIAPLTGDLPPFTTANALPPDDSFKAQPLTHAVIQVGGFKPGPNDLLFVGYGQSEAQLLQFSKYTATPLATLLP